VHFEQRDALGQVLQRDIERQPQVLFVEGAPEFPRQRLGELAGDLRIEDDSSERRGEGGRGAGRDGQYVTSRNLRERLQTWGEENY